MGLNTRETAMAIWVVGFFLIAFVKIKRKKQSSGFLNLIKAFLNKNVMVVFLAAAVWVFICIFIMSLVGFWSVENLKTSIIWFFGFACVAVLSSDNKRQLSEQEYLVRYLKNIFTLAVVVTFVAESFTFHLFFELMLFPLIVLLSGMKFISENRGLGKALERVIDFLLILIGSIYLVFSLIKIFFNPASFFSSTTALNFFIPLILTFLFIPFVMFLRSFMIYENVFKRISCWLKDDSLLRYMKIKSVISFGVNVDALQFWGESLEFKKINIKTKADVIASINAVIKYKFKESAGAEVSKELGWSPFKAKDFLKEKGLSCWQYKPKYEGWGTESRSLKVGVSNLTSIVYLVDGDEDFATSLKLKLFTFGDEDSAIVDNKFFQACLLLTDKAVPGCSEDGGCRH